MVVFLQRYLNYHIEAKRDIMRVLGSFCFYKQSVVETFMLNDKITGTYGYKFVLK
jgi:hypothetical protein